MGRLCRGGMVVPRARLDASGPGRVSRHLRDGDRLPAERLPADLLRGAGNKGERLRDDRLWGAGNRGVQLQADRL